MSEDQKQVSDQQVDQTVNEVSETEEQYVARKAYEEVRGDMFKHKARAKEAAAKASELEARLKAIEEEKLADQERWKELYEKERSEREQTKEQLESEKSRFYRSMKMAALKSELGGKVRDEYLTLANLDSIEVGEDGALSSESVRELANQFRQEHPQLIPNEGSANVTGHAPTSSVNAPQKGIEELSKRELAQIIMAAPSKNQSK